MPGYYSPSAGQVITAANWNSYVRDQVVTVFANAAARTSAITTPVEGMLTYLQDVDRHEYYAAGWWRRMPGTTVLALTSAPLNVLNLDNGRKSVWAYTWTPPHPGTYAIETIAPFDGVAAEEARIWLNVAGTDIDLDIIRFPAGTQVMYPRLGTSKRLNVTSVSPIAMGVDAVRTSGGSFFNSRLAGRTLTITYLGLEGISATG